MLEVKQKINSIIYAPTLARLFFSKMNSDLKDHITLDKAQVRVPAPTNKATDLPLPTLVRLNRHIHHTKMFPRFSRKEVYRHIKRGRVKVNGVCVTQEDFRVNPLTVQIELRDESKEEVYVRLVKPFLLTPEVLFMATRQDRQALADVAKPEWIQEWIGLDLVHGWGFIPGLLPVRSPTKQVVSVTCQLVLRSLTPFPKDISPFVRLSQEQASNKAGFLVEAKVEVDLEPQMAFYTCIQTHCSRLDIRVLGSFPMARRIFKTKGLFLQVVGLGYADGSQFLHAHVPQKFSSLLEREHKFFDAKEKQTAGVDAQAHVRFCTGSFLVEEGVTMAPRVSSETLVKVALDQVYLPRKTINVLDLGTGCGNLLIATLLALKAKYPLQKVRGLGIDISRPTLKVAQKNAALNGLSKGEARFRLCAFKDITSTLKEKDVYSIILCNPPYLSNRAGGRDEFTVNTTCTDPASALYSGYGGKEHYMCLAGLEDVWLRTRTDRSTTFVLEVANRRGQEVGDLFKLSNWGIPRVFNDQNGFDRCVMLTSYGESRGDEADVGL